MEAPRYSLLRDLVALVVVAVACPIALFGGSMLGCVGQGFTSACALNAAYISPVLLIASGLVAGLVTLGWTGLFVVLVGTAIVLPFIAGYTIWAYRVFRGKVGESHYG